MNKEVIDTFDDFKAAIWGKLSEMICDFDNQNLWNNEFNNGTKLNVKVAVETLNHFIFDNPATRFYKNITINLIERLFELNLKINTQIQNEFRHNSFGNTYKPILINVCLAMLELLEIILINPKAEQPTGLIDSYHKVLNLIITEQDRKLRIKLKYGDVKKSATDDITNNWLNSLHQEHLKLYERIVNEYKSISLHKIHNYFNNRYFQYSPYGNVPENQTTALQLDEEK